MKHQKVIVDTGPIVAFLNKHDRYHEWTKAQLARISPPLLTCEAVISESCFLLRNYENGTPNVLSLLDRKLVAIFFRLEDEIIALKNLLTKYNNIPMALADCCLVRMAEQISDSVVFTLDNDFKIYRKNNRKIIPTIMPDFV
jgi:predicted nucleic acid-binding protein